MLLHLAEGAIILALAWIIHAISVPRAWLAPAGQPGWKCCTRPALWAATIALTAGTLTAAAAPTAPTDIGALEAMLAENRRIIEETMVPVTTSPTPDPIPEPTLNTARVTMVGDSVMLGALTSLQEHLPGCIVDAQVSRQIWDATAVFDTLDAYGQLGDTIILALGTNGPFTPEEGQGLIDRLGPDRKIYWVTVYGTTLSWQEQSNSSIRAVAAKNPNVTIVDWAALAANHGEWLYSDGIHLQAAGQDAYADMITDALGYTPPPPTETDSTPLTVWSEDDGIFLTDP